jgi:hypothetical protein
MRRDGHHLWELENDGKLKVQRTRAEREEELDEMLAQRTARKVAAIKREAQETNARLWGLFGARQADNDLFESDIPTSIVARFNEVYKTIGEDAPKVYTWDQLRRAFGPKVIASIRRDVASGMRIRVMSKYLNIPFLAASDVVYELGNADQRKVKDALDLIRNGKRRVAVEKYDKLARKVAAIYERALREGKRKIAIDDAASTYWEDYFGPYGKELVREIKKRVAADLAGSWLRKNGVDEAAAEYWAAYFTDGNYGRMMTSVLPKKLSPSK